MDQVLFSVFIAKIVFRRPVLSKPNRSFYSLYYAKAWNELVDSSSGHSAKATQLLALMLKR